MQAAWWDFLPILQNININTQIYSFIFGTAPFLSFGDDHLVSQMILLLGELEKIAEVEAHGIELQI